MAYFDYQRRNSTDFRRKLKKTAKKHQKAQAAAAESQKGELQAQYHQALKESLENSPLPDDLQTREKVFVSEVSKADELISSGDNLGAAIAFYRALAIYPNPVDLLNIYDKSLKPEALDILRVLIVLEPPPVLAAALANVAAAASGPEPDLNVE